MKIDRVTMKAVFATDQQFCPVSPGFEASLEPGETPEEALSHLHAIAKKWVVTNYPSVYGSNIAESPAIEDTGKPVRTILDDIKDCTFIEGANGLKGYAMIAKTNDIWLAAYNAKLTELKIKENE